MKQIHFNKSNVSHNNWLPFKQCQFTWVHHLNPSTPSHEILLKWYYSAYTATTLGAKHRKRKWSELEVLINERTGGTFWRQDRHRMDLFPFGLICWDLAAVKAAYITVFVCIYLQTCAQFTHILCGRASPFFFLLRRYCCCVNEYDSSFGGHFLSKQTAL